MSVLVHFLIQAACITLIVHLATRVYCEARRDYFAIQAFQVRLAKYNDWTLTELTQQAYLDADAMLKARAA